ncbi:5-deoxy-glucuronate isomerase [Nocardia xishanensis]|uniref:5-deoxy-glucuronate isomerase n=1 Tax=Nocardia xishanensis TaxID=238964 RepID=A0ABW7WW53_9NOCA
MSIISTPNGLTLIRHHLTGTSTRIAAPGGTEIVLVLVTGRVTVDIGASGPLSNGHRDDPFTTPATTWYLPPGTAAIISTGQEPAEIAEIRAPLTRPPTINLPTTSTAPPPELRGQGSWQREVTTFMTPPHTAGLLVGETIARDGRWSTYPPHRHDHSRLPEESNLEEVFLFRLKPATGFGFLLTYDRTPADGRTHILGDNALASVPSGYHTVAAAGGHDLLYLWAAHGDDTTLAMHTDPAHSWLMNPPTERIYTR